MRSRTRIVLKAGVVAAALAVCGASLVSTSSAQGAVRLVQTVEVQLAGDGSIPSIQVTDYFRQSGGEERKETRDLDPQSVAGGLPVLIRSSYVTDNRTGTDLSELAGTTGTVDLSFSVTNTTGRMETVEVNDGLSGSTVRRNLMVTTPMTVILTAVLPRDARASVKKGERFTNGAVTLQDGKTVVQWGTVLAPPALPGSADFRLVVDVDNFKLEELTMTVEPGVARDFALDRIIDEVFGEGAQTPDRQTRRASGEISDELLEISGQLALVENAVKEAAVGRGRDLIVSLDTATQNLEGKIEGLKTQVTSQLTAFESEGGVLLTDSERQLESSLDEILNQIGFSGISSGAQEIALTSGEPTTVMQLIRHIRASLIGGSGGGHVDSTLISQLTDLIGSTVDPTRCITDSSLRCQIQQLGQQLRENVGVGIGQATSAMNEPKHAADGAIDGLISGLAGGETSVSRILQTAVGDLTTLKEDLNSSLVADTNSRIDDVISTLEHAGQGIDSRIADLNASISVLEDVHAALYTRDGGPVSSAAESVDAAIAALGVAETKVSSILDSMCAFPDGLGERLVDDEFIDSADQGDAVLAIAYELRAILQEIDDTEDCLGATAEIPDDLTTLLAAIDLVDANNRLDATRSGLETEIDNMQLMALGLLALRVEVDGVVTDLEEMQAELGTAGSEVSGAVDDIAAKLDDLVGVRIPAVVGQANASKLAVENLVEGVTTVLNDLERELKRQITETERELDKDAREGLASADRQIRQVANKLESDGVRNLNEARDGLINTSQSNSAKVAEIRAAIESSVASLTGTTTTQLNETQSALDENSRRVFENLIGSSRVPTDFSGLAGGGFQGVLRTELAKLIGQKTAVDTTDDKVVELGGLRRTAHIAHMLREKQQEMGLERLAGEQSPFDGEVAPGSTVATVFVFTFGKVG